MSTDEMIAFTERMKKLGVKTFEVMGQTLKVEFDPTYDFRSALPPIPPPPVDEPPGPDED